MMRALIIEHDAVAYKHLVKLLSEIAPEIKIAGQCKSVKEGTSLFSKIPAPDLVFSVINLPDGLSFEIFNAIESEVPVIFTCANESYAIDAFKSNGIYYLKKPLKKEDLAEALIKFRKKFDFWTRPGRKSNPVKYQERFLVNVGRNLKLVPAAEIAYFYTENKIVYLVTANGSKYTTRFTLDNLVDLLDPSKFFRINRQFIVNLSSISKMVPASKSRLQLILEPKSHYPAITSFGRTDNFYKWVLGK
jgi:DNA-binding LytR/AlgR family response regulator